MATKWGAFSGVFGIIYLFNLYQQLHVTPGGAMNACVRALYEPSSLLCEASIRPPASVTSSAFLRMRAVHTLPVQDAAVTCLRSQ